MFLFKRFSEKLYYCLKA